MKRLTRRVEAQLLSLQMAVAIACNDPDLAAIEPGELTVADLVRSANRKGITLGFRLRPLPEAPEAYSPHAYRGMR